MGLGSTDDRPEHRATVDLADLNADPYPIFQRLRERQPVAWVESHQMWYVTRYHDVKHVLLDPVTFTTVSKRSTIFDTFGSNVLTSDGAVHGRYRSATQHFFTPAIIRERLAGGIETASSELIAGFVARGHADLRTAFASRLPIQTMLLAFGIDPVAEAQMRGWYDSFEAALSNFGWEQPIRDRASRSVSGFNAFIDGELRLKRRSGERDSLMGMIANAPAQELTDEEIRRNLLIIFFGGISTVEALILNSLWALLQHPGAMALLCDQPEQTNLLLNEVMRWLSPVQSATRHATRDCEIAGVNIRAGDTVNCMLGAANRDPEVFPDPDRFDIHRANSAQHLGFATGPHMCLGFRLARVEAGIAVRKLLEALPEIRETAPADNAPRGYEFRQPRSLRVSWGHAAGKTSTSEPTR